MSAVGCPNCGQRLGMLREEYQQVSARRVRLCWLICVHCRHVALKDWSYVDGEERGPAREEGRGVDVRTDVR